MNEPYLLSDILSWLDQEYPGQLAEEWDNVGLLIGRTDQQLRRIMTCLTVTPNVCAEAVREKVDLIIAHHPFPFRALKRITSETVEGDMLLTLIRNGIALYSPHTAHDSAENGVNRQLATILELAQLEPINEKGAGRIGTTIQSGRTLADYIDLVRKRIGPCTYVGETSKPIRRVAVACGAADEFIPLAAQKGVDLLVTGETRFHTCLQADALGLALILPGHYATERFAMETMAERICTTFHRLDCFASRDEKDVLIVHDMP